MRCTHFTSTNLHHHTTVLIADVPNCYTMLKLVWPPYGIGQTTICLLCGFFLLLSSIFFPRLISEAADWMSTILPYMVWPKYEFRMQV